MINATSSNANIAAPKNLSAPAQNTSGNAVAEPVDTFESMFEPVTTISFGEGGISMADLAKAMKKKPDGTVTMDFSGMPGVKIEHHDQK